MSYTVQKKPPEAMGVPEPKGKAVYKKVSCPWCGDEGPHKLDASDLSGTEWFVCRNKECPFGSFSAMTRREIERMKRDGY